MLKFSGRGNSITQSVKDIIKSSKDFIFESHSVTAQLVCHKTALFHCQREGELKTDLTVDRPNDTDYDKLMVFIFAHLDVNCIDSC